MPSIELFFSNHLEFTITQTNPEKFVFQSSIKTRYFNTLEEALSFCRYEIEYEQEQIRDFNADVELDEQISLFQIAESIQGCVELDRMQFIDNVYVGNKPYEYSSCEF